MADNTANGGSALSHPGNQNGGNNNRGRRGYRPFNNNKKNYKQDNKSKKTNNNKHFEGANEALKGAIFTVRHENSNDTFDQTKDKIMTFVGSTLEAGQEIIASLKDMARYDIEQLRPEEPNDMDDLSPFDRLILEQEIKDYVRKKQSLLMV